jgi:hypothetical protein
MLAKLRKTFKELRDGEPGRRFRDHHDRHREDEDGGSRWKTAAFVAGGVLLLVAGLLLSLPPGIPGFLLWIPGLGLLVSRFRWLAAVLDRMESLARSLWAAMQRLWRRATPGS